VTAVVGDPFPFSDSILAKNGALARLPHDHYNRRIRRPAISEESGSLTAPPTYSTQQPVHLEGPFVETP